MKTVKTLNDPTILDAPNKFNGSYVCIPETKDERRFLREFNQIVWAMWHDGVYGDSYSPIYFSDRHSRDKYEFLISACDEALLAERMSDLEMLVRNPVPGQSGLEMGARLLLGGAEQFSEDSSVATDYKM